MPHLNLVFSSPAEGREDDYNRWYGELHVHDCIREIPGYAAARRYRVDPSAGAGAEPRWAYVALYELEPSSLPDVYWAVEEFRRRGAYEPPAGRVAPGHTTWVYSPADDAAVSWRADADSAVRLCLCFAGAAHRWYEERLLAEEAPAIPGFRRGTRFVRAAEQRLGVIPDWELLTVYELEREGVEELVARRRHAALGAAHATWVYEAVSERAARPAG